LGIIILEGEFIAVTQRATGYLVGTDGRGKFFGLFNKLNRLLANLFIVRGQAAVAKFGFGLDINIDGGNS